jgi:hypothetical protein
LKVTDENSGSGSVSQRYGSADPDPYQNVTDRNTGLSRATNTQEVNKYIMTKRNNKYNKNNYLIFSSVSCSGGTRRR